MKKNANLRTHAALIFLVGTAFIFYKYLLEVSPAVMEPDFISFFKVDGTHLGNIVAFYYYGYLIMQIPIGMLLDRLGPRLVMSYSIGLCAVGAFIMSSAQITASLALGRFIIGIGAVAAIIGSFKLLTLWFSHHRFAVLAGTMMSAGILGAVFAAKPLGFMVTHLGWRLSLFDLAIAGLVLMIGCYAIISNKGPYASQTKVTTQTPSLLTGLMGVLRSKQTWIISIYSGLAFAPITTLGGLWGVPFLQTTFHLAKQDAAQANSMIFLGFALGAPLAGWLSDLIGRRKPIMVIGTITSLLLLLWIVFDSHLSFISIHVLLFLFGLFTSGFIISFTMAREIHPLIYAATTLAFLNSFNAGISALADPLLGHILDITHHSVSASGIHIYNTMNFLYANLTLVAYVALAVVILPFIKETHCQQQE